MARAKNLNLTMSSLTTKMRLCRILYTHLAQQFRMPVEQTEKLVESFPLAGFSPLILGKGTDAAAEDIARLSLGQPQFPPDSPDLRRRKRFGIHPGPEGAYRR